MLQQWKLVAAGGPEGDDEGVYPFTGQSRDEAFWSTVFLDRFRFPGSVDDDGGLRLGRIPNGDDDNNNNNNNNNNNLRALFPPWGSPGSTRHFPPRDRQEEEQLVFYIRNEIIELWSFASLNLHAANLRLFRTIKGYIGVGHPNMTPGDKVVVLLGAPVPLVLREYPEGNNMVVGESYVHGIMDGEIIRDRMDTAQAKGDDIFERFRII